MSDVARTRPSDDAVAPSDPPRTILGDEVYSILGNAILDGRLQPGARLRDINLAEHLGVSRTPVREALQRLERFGLVEVSANRWTRVSTPSESAGLEAQEFLGCIIGGALRLTLPRCDEDTMTTIVLAADELIAASDSGDTPAILAATIAFFWRVIYASGNSIIVTVMHEVELSLQRNLSGWTHGFTDRAARTALYRDLRAALISRDAEAAEKYLFSCSPLPSQ